MRVAGGQVVPRDVLPQTVPKGDVLDRCRGCRSPFLSGCSAARVLRCDSCMRFHVVGPKERFVWSDLGDVVVEDDTHPGLPPGVVLRSWWQQGGRRCEAFIAPVQCGARRAVFAPRLRLVTCVMPAGHSGARHDTQLDRRGPWWIA